MKQQRAKKRDSDDNNRERGHGARPMRIRRRERPSYQLEVFGLAFIALYMVHYLKGRLENQTIAQVRRTPATRPATRPSLPGCPPQRSTAAA